MGEAEAVAYNALLSSCITYVWEDFYMLRASNLFDTWIAI